jgi:hypothetical protein
MYLSDRFGESNRFRGSREPPHALVIAVSRDDTPDDPAIADQRQGTIRISR